MGSVFITGADKGLGNALFEHFRKAGRPTFAHFLDSARVGPDVPSGFSSGDLTRKSVLDEATAAIASLPDLELIVLNAAVFPRSTLESVSHEEWQSVLSLNLTAPFFLAQAAFQSFMRRQTKGKILFIGSVSASTGSPLGAHYAASKAGIHTLVKCFSRAGQKAGIFSYGVAPGLMNTGMPLDYFGADGLERLAADLPQGRATDVTEVVDAISFLATRDEGALSGQVIHCNGGIYI